MSRTIRSNYFSDGKTIIDYVFVVSEKVKTRYVHKKYLAKYIANLQVLGIKTEVNQPRGDSLIFIKINLPSRVLKHLAHVYKIDIRNPGHHYIKGPGIHFKKFETPLTENNKDIFKRRRGATSMERILIAHEILKDTYFGSQEDMQGLAKLIKLKVVKDAFPMHDGPYRFSDEQDSELNDRQLLLKYWSNFSLWYKKQPLNLVEKYYGSEIAFYFAWLGFYNLMLIPASLFGIICFVISIINMWSLGQERYLIDEVCNSEKLMCHLCHTIESCIFSRLNSACLGMKMTYVFQDNSIIAFAIFMSLWASLFITLWKGVENVLKIRWNVQSVEADLKIRSEYKKRATSVKISSTTGLIEPCISTKRRILYITITYGVCLALLSSVILIVVGLIIYRLTVSQLLSETEALLYDYIMLMVMISGSILQVTFIKVFGLFYAPLSVWLTNIENPRTQSEFDKSVIHKRYFLGFANNYVPLFYIAFVKGRLYNPKDPDHSEGFFSLTDDICQMPGCLSALCIQLLFYMFFKSLCGNIITLIKPKILCLFKKKKSDIETVSQFEMEYELEYSDDYLLTSEFMEMIIQYGFVTFFVAAFPLAPLCALINNLMELRLDAYKFVTRHRRPVPKKYAGIGTWNGILRGITFLSTVTNGFVLAFTTDFVAKEVYKYHHNGSLNGYINSTLSTIDLTQFRKAHEGQTIDYKNDFAQEIFEGDDKVCYYQARRLSSSDPKQPFALTSDYFYDLGMKLSCVLIFEHIIVLMTGVIFYLVPEMPQRITDALNAELNIERELKIKLLAENYNMYFDKKKSSSVQISMRSDKSSIRSPTRSNK